MEAKMEQLSCVCKMSGLALINRPYPVPGPTMGTSSLLSILCFWQRFHTVTEICGV